MKRLYPDIGSYDCGYLTTEEPHRLYYEQSGNPQGIPVLYLHGGPGAGLSPNYKNFFDAEQYRIIGFEQRGCGRSKPFGNLHNNTTASILSDIQLLRQHLQIDNWVVFGGSWGATLALLTALDNPSAVAGIIVRGTFLARKQDRDWFLSPQGGAASLFPDYYQAFVEGIDEPVTTEAVCAYFTDAFEQPNEVRQIAALKRWYLWEERLSRLVLPPGTGEVTAHYPVSLMTSLAKLECHFLSNRCFISENYILDNVSRIAHIPGTIIHGRYDAICKPEAAFSLYQAWENSSLHIVPDAGHSTSEPGIAYALCGATRDMAKFIQEQTK